MKKSGVEVEGTEGVNECRNERFNLWGGGKRSGEEHNESHVHCEDHEPT
jgi:hypothetical protein